MLNLIKTTTNDATLGILF